MTNTNLSQANTNYISTFANLPWWLQWLLFSLIAFILYIPVVGNSFLSDDFLVIKKVGFDGRLNINGFFRPLSDITVWLNYRLGGLHPFVYYLTAIIIRGMSVLLLFQFCQRLQWTDDKQRLYGFSLAAAILFLTYPFHNESVAWILGRGALLAAAFGLAALVLLASNKREIWKITGACCYFFAGLAAYETVIVLPIMVLVYMLILRKPPHLIVRWQLFLLLTLAIHIAIRIAVSGSLSGGYGSSFFDSDPVDFIIASLKVIARLLVPPIQDSRLFLILATIAAVTMLLFLVVLYRKIRNENKTKAVFYIVVAFLFIALLMAFLGGVSTRTSESDRFLEFPAAFFSILVSLAIFRLFINRTIVLAVLFVVVAYQTIFLQINNRHWRLASASVRQLMQLAAQKKHDQKMFVVGLPGDINGAYVFRHGFKDALILNDIDTSGVIIFPEAMVHDAKAVADSVLQTVHNNIPLVVYWHNGEWKAYK